MSLDSLHHPDFPFTRGAIPGEPEILPPIAAMHKLLPAQRAAVPGELMPGVGRAPEEAAVSAERTSIIAAIDCLRDKGVNLTFARVKAIINGE